jgi:hypothetical protein
MLGRNIVVSVQSIPTDVRSFLVSCIAYALLAYLHLAGAMPASFGLFFGIATFVNRPYLLLILTAPQGLDNPGPLSPTDHR